jgi:hypothetical protein
MTKQRKHVEPKLGDGDYTLSDGAAWFTVGPFFVRIVAMSAGLNTSSCSSRERKGRASRSAPPTNQLKPVTVIDFNAYRARRRG